MIRQRRHWEIVKLIAKQSLKFGQDTYLIKKNILDTIKKHPNEIKEILKKVKGAEANWRMALNQFNNSITDEEVDESILRLIQCEKDFNLALNYANQRLEEILWSKNKF